MGLLDNLKNVLGSKKKDDIGATTKAPSQVLRENGIEASGLKYTFGSDGSVTLGGTIQQESDRQAIIDLLKALPGIESVNDQMTVAAPAAAAPAEPTPPPAASAPASEPSAPAAPEDRAVAGGTYTVKSGDTLWNIAKSHYGDGSKYMKIFEANKGLLDNPDRIYPGQELVIPKLD